MEFYRYALPCSFGTQACSEKRMREGILVKLAEKAWGDIAPLPGWSRESLEEVSRALKSGDALLAPSADFGIASATFSAAQPLIPHSLPVSTLLLGSAEEILQKAEISQKKGFFSAKVKISHLHFSEARDLIKTLKEMFSLRIDLNRAWPLEQSLRFFSHFSYDSFDYIEEPVSDLKTLEHFTHPFALDETLRETSPLAFLSLENLKALIFKPSLSGGPGILRQWMDYQKPIILSSAFESGVGIFQIASLIQRLALPIYPLGLDTYSFLKADLLQESLLFSEGKIHLPSHVEPKIEMLRRL
jgi:o-succinylbenzoate synthase